MMNEAKKDRPDLCVPGYSTKRKGTWLFSDLAVDAIEDYSRKWPELFKALQHRRERDQKWDIEARNIFWESKDIDYSAKKLVKYCINCAFKKLQLVTPPYMSLGNEAITEIVDTVSKRDGHSPGAARYVAGAQKLRGITTSSYSSPPSHLLFRPGDAITVGLRGVYVKPSGLVPCGTRCTVVGVYSCVTWDSQPAESTLEVVLDHDSFGAGDLQGRAPAMRGLQIMASAFMPVPPRVGEIKAERQPPDPALAAGRHPRQAISAPSGMPISSLSQPVSGSTGKIQGKLNAQLGGSTVAPAPAVSKGNKAPAAKPEKDMPAAKPEKDRPAAKPDGGNGNDNRSNAVGAPSRGRDTNARSPQRPKASAKPYVREPRASTDEMWAKAFEQLLQLGSHAPKTGKNAKASSFQ
jgi:hypothetical protein